MNSLARNPFNVRAFFDYSLTLTFAVPADELVEHLPPGLRADAFQDRWGFVAAAFVRTRKLRPAFMPRWTGRDFLLAGYRYFVRYRSAAGRDLRGLKILRSSNENPAMCRLGRIFTRYEYALTPLRFERSGDEFTLSDADEGLSVLARKGDPSTSLPETSIFANWKEARRFCGPMPFTFSYVESSHQMLIVEGQRSGWKPGPVEIREAAVPYVESLGFSSCQLAAAFVVEEIPYLWKKGRLEQIAPDTTP